MFMTRPLKLHYLRMTRVASLISVGTYEFYLVLIIKSLMTEIYNHEKNDNLVLVDLYLIAEFLF